MGITRFIFVTLLCAYSSFSFALKISGTPSGASNYDPGTSTTTTPGSTAPANTTPTIYGGVAGGENDGTCASKDNVNTCNSCSGRSATSLPVNVASCNTTRIYDSLYMVIPLTDTGGTGVAHIRLNSSTTGSSNLPIDVNTSLTSLTVTWGQICSSYNGGACSALTTDTSVQATIWIETDGTIGPSGSEPQLSIIINIWGVGAMATGIDDCDTARGAGSTGVCLARAYPGDEKIYITEAESSGSFPTSGSRKFTKLRVFASSVDWNSAIPTVAEQEVDLNLDADGNLSDRRVKGLTNGTGYFIRVATIDAANNVDAVTSDANILSTAADCGLVLTTAPAAGKNCAYYATPDEVLGLLSKDMNCFIATAAYGSQTAKYLDMLREFRLRKLLPYQWGKKFVLSYYKYGPYAAQYITDHPWLKPVTRVFLWPVIAFTWLVLHYGWTTALSAYAIAFLFLISCLYVIRNQIQIRRGRVRAE